eukprot:COSAG06_NODE_1697_length_8697_cov_2.989416_2_plen_171_part_00
MARVSGSSAAADLSFALDHRDGTQHLPPCAGHVFDLSPQRQSLTPFFSSRGKFAWLMLAAEQPALPRLTEEEALAGRARVCVCACSVRRRCWSRRGICERREVKRRYCVNQEHSIGIELISFILAGWLLKITHYICCLAAVKYGTVCCAKRDETHGCRLIDQIWMDAGIT